jgi:hypothetical protein
MSNLDDLVKINISASTATPTKPGFGTILIAAQKLPAGFTMRTRSFASLTEMTDFGFAVTDPAYLCAQKMKAQNPSITSWKVGKRANKTVQTLKLKCKSNVQGDVYTVTINGTPITYTVLAAATTTTVATAIELLIEAVTGVDSTSATDTITFTVTAGAGELIDVKGWSTNFEFTDASADPGLAADLAAIKAFDNNWYGLALDSASEAEVNVAALFVETEKKLFVPNSSDFGCEDVANVTDVMSDIKGAAYARTGVLYSRSQLLSYSGPAWMAKQFTQNPGSDTWMFKTLAAVTVDVLNDAGRAAILGKNGNCYTATSGINMTEQGKSGAGEYLDITRFVDWLRAEIQFRVFSALVNNSKIPYTDEGIDLISSIISGALKFGVERGGLVKGTTSVTFPLAADIDSATRGLRSLTGGKFAGKLAGAIHSLDIAGLLTN